jgi:hypothetical protein
MGNYGQGTMFHLDKSKIFWRSSAQNGVYM